MISTVSESGLISFTQTRPTSLCTITGLFRHLMSWISFIFLKTQQNLSKPLVLKWDTKAYYKLTLTLHFIEELTFILKRTSMCWEFQFNLWTLKQNGLRSRRQRIIIISLIRYWKGPKIMMRSIET